MIKCTISNVKITIFIAFEFLQRGRYYYMTRYFYLKIFKMHRIFLFNDAKSLNYSKTDFSCLLISSRLLVKLAFLLSLPKKSAFYAATFIKFASTT